MASPAPTDPKRYADLNQGWNGFTHTLSRVVPYKLTKAGQARKALYALMYPTRR